MPGLMDYGNWLFERAATGLPTNVKPPAHVERYEDWYVRIRNLPAPVDVHRPSDYGNWLFERHQKNLPLDHPPPPHVESYEAWYRRVRGMELYASPAHGPDTARARGGRYAPLLALAGIPLAATAAGFAALGFTRAEAMTRDAADLAGGLTPTNGSFVQKAIEAINAGVPRGTDDVMRIAARLWKPDGGVDKAVALSSPTVPISR